MSKTTKLLLVLPLCLLALSLNGCNRQNGNNSIPPAVTPPAVHIRVKLGRPGDDWELKREIYVPDGVRLSERQTFFRKDSPKSVAYEHFAADGKTLTDRRTEFRDGHILLETFFRSGPAQGNLAESTETYPGGTVTRVHILYDLTGAVAGREEYRADGTLKTAMKLLPDGSSEIRSFWADGVLVYSVELDHPDGSKEITSYRKDGKRLFSREFAHADQSREVTYYRTDGATVWAELSYQDQKLLSMQINKPDGTPDQRRTFRDDGGFDVVVYRLEGARAVPAYRQIWQVDRNGFWWSKHFVVSTVDELRADGKTRLRRLVYREDGKTLKEAVSYNADGSKKSIRYFRAADGTLEREEFFDAAGKVTRTDQVEAGKGIHETVDPGLVAQPPYDDPTDSRVQRD